MTKIPWTQETWNPIVGCMKISPGCRNCYAEKMANRLSGMGQEKYTTVTNEGKWNGQIVYDPAVAESGPRRRPFDEEWARVIKNQCVRNNVPFFYKQKYIGNNKIVLPLLDGQIWNQMPKR